MEGCLFKVCFHCMLEAAAPVESPIQVSKLGSRCYQTCNYSASLKMLRHSSTEDIGTLVVCNRHM